MVIPTTMATTMAVAVMMALTFLGQVVAETTASTSTSASTSTAQARAQAASSSLWSLSLPSFSNILVATGVIVLTFILLGDKISPSFKRTSTLVNASRSSKTVDRDDDVADIPSAPGAIPILGHALVYKNDPTGFLKRCSDDLGPIFRINLAGKRMVIVSQNCPALRQITMLSESVASSYQAIAVAGFEETLGYHNVHLGAGLQRRILRSSMIPSDQWHAQFPTMLRILQASLQTELEQTASHRETTNVLHCPSLFAWIRRATIRFVIEFMISKSFVDRAGPSFIRDFQRYEDDLEVAIAQSSVLPRWIGLTCFLLPVRRQREALQRRIATVLDTIDDDAGYWLRDARKLAASNVEVAEYLIGLLFAAHKNPSIAASQMFLFVRDAVAAHETLHEEARIILRDPTVLGQTGQQTPVPLFRKSAMETLRVTSHTIGSIRLMMQDVPLEGTRHIIRKGETIAMDHHTRSTCREVWKSGEALDISSETKRDGMELYEDRRNFASFSLGVHHCPGEKLSVVTMQMTVACLLQQWESIEALETSSQLRFDRPTLAQRSKPIPLKVTLKK